MARDRTTSDWRLRARRVIRATLASLPADADLKAKRRALREAYPWARVGWAYQCWLKEQRAALGPAEKKAGPAAVRWTVGPAPTFWVRVDCGWCGNKNFGRGCLVCGPLWERLHGKLSEDDGLIALLEAARATPADPLPRLILADYLEELQ